ncbi:MAG TPA: ion transporter [Balneolaceae bacterium]|nr:ion transporter [Balneolaceae bacterium]
MTLKKIIEETDTKTGRAFDLTIQILIVYSLITFSISTLPGLSHTAQQFLHLSQITVVAIFTIEYVLRIVVADRKLGYIFSFYGVIDLMAIFPFYITYAVDLRAIRIVRLLRVFRIFKVARYVKAVERYGTAFKSIKEELVVFFGATFFLIYLSAVGIYYFEHIAQPEAFQSIFHSLWWAIATLTTVGYGDIVPITIGGKIFTFFILMIGLSIVAVPAGLLAVALQKSVRSASRQ